LVADLVFVSLEANEGWNIEQLDFNLYEEFYMTLDLPSPCHHNDHGSWSNLTILLKCADDIVLAWNYSDETKSVKLYIDTKLRIKFSEQLTFFLC